jgi:hypothetical protein
MFLVLVFARLKEDLSMCLGIDTCSADVKISNVFSKTATLDGDKLSVPWFSAFIPYTEPYLMG